MTTLSSFVRFWDPASFPILEDRLMVLLMAVVLNGVLLTRRAYIDFPPALVPGHWLTRYFQAAERKLNRQNRSPNARFIRGLVVMLPPLLIAWAAGGRLAEWSAMFKYSWLISVAALAAMLHTRVYVDTASRLLNWNHDMSLHESRKDLDLISPYDHHVLDLHGLFRQALECLGTAFGERLAGIGLWFLLGGLPMAMIYYALLRAFRAIGLPTPEMQAFGTVARTFYYLMAAWPAWFGSLLLSLSALFAPATRIGKSLAAFVTGVWRFPPSQLAGFIYAEALGLQLGGKKRLPNGQTTTGAWVGSGDPKVSESQLRYGLRMFQAAWLLFVGVLGVGYLYME